MLTKYIQKNLTKGSIIAVLALSLTACRKFVTIDPPSGSMVQETVFKDAQASAAALRNAYEALPSLNVSISLVNALYPDEYRLTTSDQGLRAIYTNSPEALPGSITSIWKNSFNAIYKANAIIEGLQGNGSAFEKSLKDHMIGEALLIRALSYYWLVNLYGDVPLLLTTDYTKNRLASRTPANLVYDQIVKDLTDAKGLMSSDYLDWDNKKVTNRRFRANKEAAAALLARIYLYRGEWAKAETEATEVISKNTVYSLEPVPANAFNMASKETVLALEYIAYTYPLPADSYILTADPNNSTTAGRIGVVSDTLLGSFEAGDNRRRDWIDVFTTGGSSYYFANKYKISTTLTQYDGIIRLAELYLIRAEARLEQGLKQAAIDDLNVIRDRARAAATGAVPNPLPALASTLTDVQVRRAMEKERFTELFTEGHRWFDFKRWKGINNTAISRADEAMPAIAAKKGTTWKSHLKLFPILPKEFELNVNMEQTPGY